jgi:hypothetical protein
MNRTVGLTKRVQTEKGLRYCPVVLAMNGRIRAVGIGLAHLRMLLEYFCRPVVESSRERCLASA